MNCKTARSLMEDYLERRLVVLDRNELVRHVSECLSCEDELTGYRDVFEFLRSAEPVEVPRGFQNAVISQLKAEGVIYQPTMPRVRRWLGTFLALPGFAKYPLAASAIIAALYFPLILILGHVKGIAVNATVFATSALMFVQAALGDVSFLTRVADTVGRYAKTGKTVLSALLSLVASLGDNVWVLSITIFAVLLAILAVSHLKKKRSSHNAPSGF